MKIKRCLVILMFFCIIICFSTVAYAEKLYTTYLALGDSITAGDGLKDVTDGNSYILKEILKINDEDFKNLAVSGMTAEKFNETIRTDTYTDAIKNADLITISIGSNEIFKTIKNTFIEISGITAEQTKNLELFNQIMTEKVSGNGVEGLKNLYSMITELYERLSSDEVNTELMNKIQQYKVEWGEGIEYIKSINPNATVVVLEFYNPYYNFVLLYDWGEFADKYIKEFNKYLYEISENETKYKIAKIYEDFNTDNPRITNASTNFFAFSIDPHPNKEGHKTIANRVIEVLNIEEQDVNNKGSQNINNINIIIIIGVLVTVLAITGTSILITYKKKIK